MSAETFFPRQRVPDDDAVVGAEGCVATATFPAATIAGLPSSRFTSALSRTIAGDDGVCLPFIALIISLSSSTVPREDALARTAKRAGDYLL